MRAKVGDLLPFPAVRGDEVTACVEVVVHVGTGTVLVLEFEPYSHEQLERIVLSRLKLVPGSMELFRPESITMCARKVASKSGDVRKVLDICRCVCRVSEFCASCIFRVCSFSVYLVVFG